MTGVMRDRHLDTRTMMWDAASMFLSSPTAHGKSIRSGYIKLARRAAHALKREMGEGDVKYGKENRTFVRTGSDPYRITIDYRLSNSLAGTSVRLLHEALHASWHGHTIDEELHSRRLEVMYFHNLLKTKWQFTTRSGHREWSTRLRRNDPVDQSLQLTDMERFDARNQLVDYVLRADPYYKRINDTWVKKNLDYWGGLTNRWPETRGLYVAKLAAKGGADNARVVKRILQSLLELHKFSPPPQYRSPYKLSPDPLNGFAMFAAGGLGNSSHDGWKVVRKAIAPLLRDGRERTGLESIERQLNPFGGSIYLVNPQSAPQL